MNIFRATTIYGIGEIGSRIPLLMLELFLASALGPAIYGLWSILQSVILYGNFLHFGSVPALIRREPRLRVKGQLDEIIALRGATYGFQSAVIVLVLIVGIIIFALFPSGSLLSDDNLILLPAILITVYLQQIQMTTQGSAINISYFTEVTISRLMFAFFFLIFGFKAAHTSNQLIWLLLSWSTALLIATSFLIFKLPQIRARPTLDRVRSEDLVKDGFPIFVQSLLRLLLMTLDKLLVWQFAVPALLGIYALGTLAAGLNTMLIAIVCRSSLPRLLTRRAQLDNDAALAEELHQTLYTGLHLAFLGAAIIGAFSPLVIATLLPHYSDGYWTTTLLACYGAFMGFSAMCADIALSFGFKRRIIIATIIGLCLYGLVLILMWLSIATIEASAILALLFSALYSVALGSLCYKALGLPFQNIIKYIKKYIFSGLIMSMISLLLTSLQIQLISRISIESIYYWLINFAFLFSSLLMIYVIVSKYRHFIGGEIK